MVISACRPVGGDLFGTIEEGMRAPFQARQEDTVKMSCSLTLQIREDQLAQVTLYLAGKQPSCAPHSLTLSRSGRRERLPDRPMPEHESGDF